MLLGPRVGRPEFPDRFGSSPDVCTFSAVFFEDYHHEHRHSGLGLRTTAPVHYGTATEIRA